MDFITQLVRNPVNTGVPEPCLKYPKKYFGESAVSAYIFKIFCGFYIVEDIFCPQSGTPRAKEVQGKGYIGRIMLITSFSAEPSEMAKYAVCTQKCDACHANPGWACRDPSLRDGRVHVERFKAARAQLLELLNATAQAHCRDAKTAAQGVAFSDLR